MVYNKLPGALLNYFELNHVDFVFEVGPSFDCARLYAWLTMTQRLVQSSDRTEAELLCRALLRSWIEPDLSVVNLCSHFN